MAGLLAVITVALGVSGWAVAWPASGRPTGPRAESASRPRVLPGPIDRASGARTATAVAALLDHRAAAVLRRDRGAFLASVDPVATPSAGSFRQRQAALFDNLAGVPVGSWSYDFDPASARTVPAAVRQRYDAAVYAPDVVLVHYRLRGFDAMPTTTAAYLTFVRRAGRWYLGGDNDFTAAGLRTGRDLWDFGPVLAVSGRASLVLGHPAERGMLPGLRDVTDAAVPRVTAVWGAGWARRVVVEVPGSSAELAEIVGQKTDLSRIAAVATAELGGNRHSAGPVGDRVLVNPPNFATLGAIGRRVVLTHEVTHVATRAATGSGLPTWLVEGFADYVAYLHSGVPVRAAAAELAVDLLAGRRPAALPADAEFAGSNPALAQAYEKSWLACRLIAERVGAAGLVRFYRLAGGRAGNAAPAARQRQVRQAFGVVLHSSPEAFTAAWRGYLLAALA